MHRPDDREIDDEIRGHLALAIKDRVDRGEDPDAARRAAYAEFGYLPAARDEIRQVWYSRWSDAALDFVRDVRVGVRSLRRAKGLSIAVVATLALGIGANAAIFSVVRGVLLRPLVNRDEQQLVYVRQSAPGLGTDNMTFSVPEIADLSARVTDIRQFGDFSTIEFTMIGLGEPRVVHAGVVSGSFFDVMGLRPVLGRLITTADDGRNAPPVAVLTHRFWTTALNADATVVGRTIRLDTRTATIVGVLEPAVPYPADTEIIANVVTSPHHMDALMVTGRTHRMTELFGRLAPDATLESARAQIVAAHTAMMGEHPEAYAASGRVQVEVRQLRDQIATPARTILLLLMGTAALVFVIACSNVGNLILARSIRREGELAVRAALGASRGALRRTLLAESLVLCGAGAVLGVLLAPPLVAVVGRFAARFSVRALDVTVDGSVLWICTGLAAVAAILLAYVPRLPGAQAPAASTATTGVRVTSGASRRLKTFATAQIALTFVLLAGAGTLLSTLLSLQQVPTGFALDRVVAFDVPLPIEAYGPTTLRFVDEALRRIRALPGVEGAAASNVVPWRDAGKFGPFPVAAANEGTTDARELPRAVLRNVTPGFFATMGVPLLAGREFTDDDPRAGDRVAIISQSVADRLFPTGNAIDQRIRWMEPMFGRSTLRVVGVVGDVHDESVDGAASAAIYHPLRQVPFAGRLFVRAAGDPATLIPAVTRVVREISAEQPVERAATLADVRAEVLTPTRVNAFVVTGFAGVALLIAVVGVAGVLAFLVSARTREFGVRLAVGSTPGDLLASVLREGLVIAGIGIGVGAVLGDALVRATAIYFGPMVRPDPLPLATAGGVVLAAALAAALLPASRASRVDVLQALRTD